MPLLQLQCPSAALTGVESLASRVAAGEVGFADLPLSETAEQVRAALAAAPAAEMLVVLGIGGSSLGAQALLAALGKDKQVRFIDNLDPHTVQSSLAGLDFSKCLFNVITKSGGTVETISLFLHCFHLVASHIGETAARSRFVVTTDPQNGALRELAAAQKLVSLPVPANIGGRFSVLTAVGLFPALFAGVDIDEVLRGAARAKGHFRDNIGGADADAAQTLAGHMVDNINHGRTVAVWFGYGDRLLTLGAWFCQLWGESLGKVNHDGTPVAGTPIVARGATDQHSQLQLYAEGPDDKVYWFVSHPTMPGPAIEASAMSGAYPNLVGHHLGDILAIERQSTRAALAKAGRPTVDLRIELSASGLGAAFYFLQLVTAYAGTALGVDPFNQPGVEASKQIMRQAMTGDETGLAIDAAGETFALH